MLRPAALSLVLALAAAAGLSACAARPKGAQATAPAPTAPGDPFEATNRRILDFNFKVDEAIYRPAAEFYRRAVGPWTRTRVRNALNNLNEPRVAANALLQGRPLAAGTSVMRFTVNSTLGLGGMFDLEPIGGPPARPSTSAKRSEPGACPTALSHAALRRPSTPRSWRGRWATVC
jgi:ABC-type transporter lipoprotein component MlaA